MKKILKSAKSVARPFSKFFDKQVDACLSLGAEPLRISKVRLDALLSTYGHPLYPKDRVELIKKVIVNRLDYYRGSGLYVYY